MPVHMPVEFDVTVVELIVKRVVPRLRRKNPLPLVKRRAALFQGSKSSSSYRRDHGGAQGGSFRRAYL